MKIQPQPSPTATRNHALFQWLERSECIADGDGLAFSVEEEIDFGVARGLERLHRILIPLGDTLWLMSVGSEHHGDSAIMHQAKHSLAGVKFSHALIATTGVEFHADSRRGNAIE